MRSFILSLFGLVAACTGGSDSIGIDLPDPAYREDPSGTRYVNTAGTHQVFLSGGVLYIGPTEEHAARLHQQQQEAHISSLNVSECSDDGLRCLRADRLVFAVPREGLAPRTAYATQGVRFRVQSCRDASCNVATIRAICERS